MGVQYIVAIAAGGIFTLLFLVWFGLYIFSKVREKALYNRICQMYNDENLAEMNYDFANYDDETARIVSVSRTEGQLTIDDVLFDATANSADEGLEEITGNYKPD